MTRKRINNKHLDSFEWMHQKYIIEQKYIREIANNCNCGLDTVRKRLKHHGIALRPKSFRRPEHTNGLGLYYNDNRYKNTKKKQYNRKRPEYYDIVLDILNRKFRNTNDTFNSRMVYSELVREKRISHLIERMDVYGAFNSVIYDIKKELIIMNKNSHNRYRFIVP